MIEAIKYAYPSVKITAFPRARHILSIYNYDFVWLNWCENIGSKKRLRNIITKIIILIVIKIMGIKIISTYHNIQPHEYKNTFFEKLLFYMTFRCANKIIVLSDDSKKYLFKRFGKLIISKICLVPHPSYECKPKQKNKINYKFSVLFFGQLRPYKNIELIFKVAKIFPTIDFTIAGQPINEIYKKELISSSENLSNVKLIPQYLSESDIDSLIDQNSIIMLPYNINSSLNSGVVIHAICKGINVIVPTIGTVNQLINSNAVFKYSYKTEVEHLEQLYKVLTLAQEEYSKKYDKFLERINCLHNEVINNQSPMALSKYVKKVFQ